MNSLFEAPAVQATIFGDGGSRGNPGPAASGAIILSPDGTVLAEIGRYLGIATNNVAEWNAVLDGLAAAKEMGFERIAIRLDSELVVKQLTGEYRVKHEGLAPLAQRAKQLLRSFSHIDLAHVRREKNKLADALVNRVLDEQAAGDA